MKAREEGMTMKANEVARPTGVSVYTVRYCQRIGLLTASKDAHSGYHEFSATDACADRSAHASLR